MNSWRRDALRHDPRNLCAVLAATNSNTPVGTLYGPKQNITLLATNAMRSAAEYKDVVVAWRNGAPVRLREVANVIDDVANNQVAGWFNKTPAVGLAIHRQPGANTIEVVNEIKDNMANYRAQVPAAINLEILADRSVSITAMTSSNVSGWKYNRSAVS